MKRTICHAGQLVLVAVRSMFLDHPERLRPLSSSDLAFIVKNLADLITLRFISRRSITSDARLTAKSRLRHKCTTLWVSCSSRNNGQSTATCHSARKAKPMMSSLCKPRSYHTHSNTTFSLRNIAGCRLSQVLPQDRETDS